MTAKKAAQPQLPEDIFQGISDGYYQLTASERKLADYALAHCQEAQFLSITQLAEVCGVAEATVSRFCRRLHFSSYNAFKLSLAKAAAQESGTELAVSGDVLPGDSIPTLSQKLYNADLNALNQSLELISPEAISRAVDLLAAARRVYCMGQGGSMIMAQEAAHLFSTASSRFFAVSDSHLQASAAALTNKEDVILFFSYSGSTKDVVDLMEVARGQGARVILITHFPKSPGAQHADVILQCGSNESPLQLGSVPARIAQLFLVDVLFCELCRRCPERAEHNREQIAAALATKHL